MEAAYASGLAELAAVLGAGLATEHRATLLALLRETDGRVDVVLNRFLDRLPSSPIKTPGAPAPAPPLPHAKRPPSPQPTSPPEAKRRPEPEPPVQRPQPAPERAATDAPAAAWPRLLGTTVVRAFAMVSGRDRLVPGDAVILERVRPAGGAASAYAAGGAGPSGPGSGRRVRPDNIIVRMVVRGHEVGKLASDVARYVAKARYPCLLPCMCLCVRRPCPRIGSRGRGRRLRASCWTTTWSRSRPRVWTHPTPCP
jgi:hypothetical protein